MSDRYAEMDEVLVYIQRHLDEPLTVSRLAAHVAYSPFHFIRIFKERTGLSPQYYVSSLRLERAKSLLLQTNMSVRDVGLEIGQQSLGTFTTRFTERVGMTPSEFRNSAHQTELHLQSLRRLSDWRERSPIAYPFSVVEGTIEAERPFEGVILLGLFAKPIPEGMPLYGTLLSGLGPFQLTGIQPGVYYLMATSVEWGTNAHDVLLPSATLRTRVKEPIVIRTHGTVVCQSLRLYEPRLDDPPILISLPLLMKRFLGKVMHPMNKPGSS